MSDPSVSVGTQPPPGKVTNLLAGCWAVLAFYLMARSLLITREWVACIVAPIPLLAVWATMERKRWGRLTLLGISLTALGLTMTALGLAACLDGEGHTPAYYALQALNLYTHSPGISLTVVVLALVTGLWLRRESVVAEFEQNKRPVLKLGQQAIAGMLVVCWTLLVMFAPLTARDPMDKLLRWPRSRFGHQASINSRINRSDEARNNR